MEFNGMEYQRILDDETFNLLKQIIKNKTPTTLYDDIKRIQKAKKKQKDNIKRPKELEDKKSLVKAYYYVLPLKSKGQYCYHIYTPSGITILKVPQSMLGSNVLGTANLKTNRIQILETLYGAAFEEVKKHELNHIKYPYLSEYAIREMTRAQLPFYPIFH